MAIELMVEGYERCFAENPEKVRKLRHRTQAVSVLEAIRCTTLHGAYGSYEEEIKGSLEPDKLADIVVLSDDILKINPMDIAHLKVAMIMIDGVAEYTC